MRGSKSMVGCMFLAILLGGCERAPRQVRMPAPPATSPGVQPSAELGEPADPSFIGRVWQSTTFGSPRGSFMIFLPDRTLVQDSCFETYRLSKWGAAGNLIRWVEDTLPVEAEIEVRGKDQLILRVRGIDKEQSFVAASVPYLCPDTPK